MKKTQKLFEELEKTLIDCYALYYDGYIYILTKAHLPKEKREKRWYMWIEPWGTIRFPIFQAIPEASDKDILFTNDPLCKEIALIPESFIRQYNSPVGIRKNILVDQFTNTIFTFLWAEKGTKKILFQTFHPESYVV